MQALVTGGAQGIGYKIVESLINDGFSITIFDINPETLNKAKASFGCEVFEFDVSFDIGEPDALTASGVPTDVLCTGGNTGYGSYTITGGTPPYTKESYKQKTLNKHTLLTISK